MNIVDFIDNIKEMLLKIEARGDIIKIPQVSAMKTGRGHRYLFNTEPYHKDAENGMRRKFLHPKEFYKCKDNRALFLECHWSNEQKAGLVKTLMLEYKIELDESEDEVDEEILSVVFDEDADEEIDIDKTDFSVSTLKGLYERGQLLLDTKIQRREVWTEKQMTYLIDTIIRKLSIPKLYMRVSMEDESEIFRVIDGKQRLRSIFLFMGLIPKEGKLNKFRILGKNMPRGKPDPSICGKTWDELDIKTRNKILLYPLSIEKIITGGEKAERDMFYRLNVYVKSLNKQEIRHSQYDGVFNDVIELLVDKYSGFLIKQKIIPKSSFRRMVDSEFVALLVSMIVYGLTNKKDKLDDCYSSLAEGWDPTETERKFHKIMKTIQSIGNMGEIEEPKENISSTIFKGRFSFECLFYVIQELLKRGKKFSEDSLRDIWTFLCRFTIEFRRDIEDIADKRIVKFKEVTIQAGDTLLNRIDKTDYLMEHIEPLVVDLDKKRDFTDAQKQFVWHTSDKICAGKFGCRKRISSYEDCVFDHILAHSKGGRTTIDNCQVMHKICNLKKSDKV